MDYKKPQTALISGGDGIYPLTTADQVIRSDGSRLEQNGKVYADSAADSSKLNGKTWAQVLDAIYPVGSVYMSFDPTSPARLFGGTWEQIKDRFLLAAGDTYSAGATGGEATHTLTVNEMPNHMHAPLTINGTNLTVWADAGSEPNFDMTSLYTTGPNNNIFRTGFSGGSQPHNNMPPYLAVYMWKRVS